MSGDPGEAEVELTDVVDALSELFVLHGEPTFIRSDNGPEFVAQVVQNWITAVGAKIAYIESGY